MALNLSLLSYDDLQKIHKTALEIIEKKGIKIESAEARQICKAAGAIVEDNNIVKFPSFLVHEVLKTCLPKITLFQRNSDSEVVLGNGCTKNNVSGWTQQIIDWRTGEHRSAVESDIIESIKVINALDEVHWARAPLICSEWQPDEIELYQYKYGVEHSNKPLLLCASDKKTVEKLVHLGALLAGGQQELVSKPNFVISLGIMSPFLLTENFCDVTIACAKLGIPICFYTSSMVGATTPVTLSGTVACNHAEIISALAIAKLVNPEAKILYLNYSKPFDMQHAEISSGSPEFGLLAAAQTQAGKHIGLPSGIGMFYTNSPQLDVQAGFEKMGSALLPALSDADFSCGIGNLANAGVYSLEAMVIDAEMICYVNRLLQGINCDNNHCSLEVFDEVAPMGDFLTSLHTLKYFRTELSRSKVSYRGSYSTWESSPKTDSIVNKTREFIEQAIANNISPGLPDKFADEFEKIKGM